VRCCRTARVLGFHLLLTPTMAQPPPPIGIPHERLGTTLGLFTLPFSYTGQPAISLPVHWTPDGLPVGVQLVAAFGREDLLLRVAAQLEQALPWAGRLPPLHAAHRAATQSQGRSVSGRTTAA
jgi:amidase